MSHASSPTPIALVGVNTKAGGQDVDGKQESDSIEKTCVIKSALLEDGELEEGELDGDDDVGVDSKTDQQIFHSPSEIKIQSPFDGTSVNEVLEKSSATFESVKKPKEIPSLFDLKTTKPKSMKRLINEKGKMTFPNYIDHDRIDDGGWCPLESNMNYNGQENMAVGMWSGYSIPNDDYESSDCDAVPNDEFSVEIQQMLNRSTSGAASASNLPYDSEKGPRGPYDSPSEDEENESIEFQPPSKLQKVEDDICVSYGLITAGSKKAPKKQLAMAPEFVTNCDKKKAKLTGIGIRKHIEPNLSEIKSSNEPQVATEKRRLVDTPMEERPQCKFYFEGKCKKGVNCPFNHDMKRLIKSELCHFYMSGQCSKGNDCVFNHELKSSAEDDDRKTDSGMHKKRKALLGSPPAMLRIVQPKDNKKIPSLFDIQINADGPNTKEILQSAARRSVMRQSTNPKPGLLGVAPPMIAAAVMMAPVRASFPIGAQGYYETLVRPQPHKKIEDTAWETLRQRSDITCCEVEENVPDQQRTILNKEKNESLQDSEVLSTVDNPSQNQTSDFSCSSSMYSSTSMTVKSSNIQFVTQNSMCSDLQSAFSVPIYSHYQIIPPESSILSHTSANSLLLPQLEVPLPSSTEEMDAIKMIPVSPMVEDITKPQIVGGVDINHLPPKQRELYLRMFANQKQADDVPAGQHMTEKTSLREDEERIHPVEKNSNSQIDLLKLFIPVSSQCTGQSLAFETVASKQSSLTQGSVSSGSSFSINHMLTVICGAEAGLITKEDPLTTMGPAVLENAKQAEPVFEVSGSLHHGPYQLQCVTLEGKMSTLPSHIDPMDPKYIFDPRVQKHKDEIVMHSSLKPNEQTLTVLPVEPTVYVGIQRRDPRLAKNKAVAVTEETSNQPQQQQLATSSVQCSVMRDTSQQTLVGAVLQDTIQVHRENLLGRMTMGVKQQGSMPTGFMHQVKKSLESIQHFNMSVGDTQKGNLSQSNLPMGCMWQGRMPMVGMQEVNMQMGGIQQGNMPVCGIAQSAMQVNGILQGNMPRQQVMSMGNMQQSNMLMGTIQQGNMHVGDMQHSVMVDMQRGNRPVRTTEHGNILMGGMQKHVGIPVCVTNQSGLFARPMLQGGIRAGGVQQNSLIMSSGQQGGMTDGGNGQNRTSAEGLQLGGAMPGSCVPMNDMQCNGMQGSGMHQGGMSVNGMQQQMNIPVLGDMQQGGLLPHPSGSFLPQRGLPVFIRSQASVVNCFPRSVNTQPPFKFCNRVGILQHDTIRPEFMPTNHDRLSDNGGDGVTSGAAVANSISICEADMFTLIQSNPVFVQPQPNYSSHHLETINDDINQTRDIVCSSELLQVRQSSQDVDVFLENKDGCNQRSSLGDETLNDAGLTSNVERILNYEQEDHRFRKKAQMNDSEINSSDVTCKSGKMQSNESNANARQTVVRNKDKLEFRSPLADMGDSGSSLLISGYNQPPNKRYQQLAEENNLRRSGLSKATNKNSGKQKQRSTSHQMPLAAQNELLPPGSLNLQPTPDAMNDESALSVQSVKDMFKSIDPTASPFC